MRLARVALLLALAGALLAARWPLLSDPAPAAGGGGRDAAVVVGIERHMLVARIPGAEANAIAWYDYLVQTRGIPIAQAALLVDGDATREEILSAAKRASAQVQQGGTLWFVFVGHGAPARADGDGLLVGFDAQQKPRSIRARSVAQSELLAELQESRAASIHVFLDACFSGRTSTGGLLVPGLQPLEVVVEGPSADPRTLLFTAARGDEYAGPLPGGARPAFSYLALGGLRGWADRAGDGEITAAELHRYVADALGALLRDRDQTPTFVGAAPDAGARVLAQSPGEHGPDLAHVAREIASDDRRSTFQPTAPRRIERPVPPPSFEGRRAGLDFRDVDVKVLSAYDAAVKFDRTDAAPRLKARRWAALADAAPELRTIALARAAEWQDFERREREAQLASERRAAAAAADWEKLARLLQLEVVPPERKREWAEAFLEEYGDTLGRNPYLVRLARLLPPELVSEPLRRIQSLEIEWVPMPSGRFLRGASTSKLDRSPVREITLAGFEIMKTEITVAMYRACVADGGCVTAGADSPWWEGAPQPAHVGSCNFRRKERARHPLNCVAWEAARDFCAWLGGDLPTEAQWEYAAGGRHRLVYPWGEGRASCSRAIMNLSSNGCGWNRTSPVCSRTAGNTPEGVCDMAGNVFEWTRDWYAGRYYAYARSQDPPGPPSGTSRVIRGGAWLTDASTLEVTRRAALEPESRYHGLGARCARPLY